MEYEPIFEGGEILPDVRTAIKQEAIDQSEDFDHDCEIELNKLIPECELRDVEDHMVFIKTETPEEQCDSEQNISLGINAAGCSTTTGDDVHAEDIKVESVAPIENNVEGELRHEDVECVGSERGKCERDKAVEAAEEPGARVPPDLEPLARIVAGRETYCCQICPYKTRKSAHMRTHLLIHYGTTKRLEVAEHDQNQRIKSAREAEEPVKIVPKDPQLLATFIDGQKTYRCEFCPYKITKISSMRKHLLVHTREKPFKCGECAYSSSQHSALKRHTATHKEDKLFKCTICSYSGRTAGTLKRHVTTHCEDKPFKCGECAYSANRANSLKLHTATHTGDKPFKCTMCTYSTLLVVRLNRHMAVHTGERPYKCGECSYDTSWPRALKVHMATHTGERPYKCAECPYSSITSCNLKTHAAIHSGRKPYKCSVCPFGCANSSNLKTHMAIHLGEKRFQCGHCGHKSRTKKALTVHITSKHK